MRISHIRITTVLTSCGKIFFYIYHQRCFFIHLQYKGSELIIVYFVISSPMPFISNPVFNNVFIFTWEEFLYISNEIISSFIFCFKIRIKKYPLCHFHLECMFKQTLFWIKTTFFVSQIFLLL